MLRTSILSSVLLFALLPVGMIEKTGASQSNIQKSIETNSFESTVNGLVRDLSVSVDGSAATMLEPQRETTQQSISTPQVKTGEVAIDFAKEQVVFEEASNVELTDQGLQVIPWEDSGIAISEVIPVPVEEVEPFLGVDVEWRIENSEAGKVRIGLRVSRDGKTWGEWNEVSADEHSVATETGRFFGNPLLFEKESRFFQYRIVIKREPGIDSPKLILVRIRFVSPGATPKEKLEGWERRIQEWEETSALAALTEASLPKPPVVSRVEWGVPTRCSDGRVPPSWPVQPTSVTHMIIHHTVTSNSASDWAAQVRLVWELHACGDRLVRGGAGDIGYNFLVAPNGVMFEGRARAPNDGDSIGAHFLCMNLNTMGVAFLGTYTDVPPTSVALSSAEQLLAWKSAQRNIDPLGSSFHPASQLSLSNIAGHRDGNDSPSPSRCNTTSCPGDALWNLLPRIRNNVHNLLSGGFGRVTIASEDFEGPFPRGNWRIFDNDETTNGEYFWGKDNHRSNSGQWSAYCVRGGRNGRAAPGPYPNNAKSWMLYGPFSLTDAMDAGVDFSYWLRTVGNGDYLGWFASINGQNFYGRGVTGNSNGWRSRTFDLKDVPTLGNLMGQPQVWIAFIFESDSSVTDEGVYLDDITIWTMGFSNPVGTFTLYGEDSQSNLYTINKQTGRATLIGSTGFRNITDIAFSPRGILYGVTPDSLLVINASNAFTFNVGSLGVNDAVAAIADSDLALLVGTRSGQLLRVITGTGIALPIGSYGSSLGSSGDLVIASDGTLLGSAFREGSSSDFLVRIDKRTGRATIIGAIGFRDVLGLAFDSDGTLYGAANGNGRGTPTLIRIDPRTGQGIAIGSFGTRDMFGLAAR